MRIVIKIGSSTITHGTGRLNIRQVEMLCKVISDIKNAGNEVILVSSGAGAMGAGKLGLTKRPADMPSKQAVAAVGQCELMYIYDKLFSEYNLLVAQVLLTAEDFRDERRHFNITNTLNRLLEMDTIPIINENDTVATEEFGIGDNDTLSAIVAVNVRADLLILLSDIDGVFTADPHAHPDASLIPVIDAVDEQVRSYVEGTRSAFGTGGLGTKLEAAELVTGAGIDMILMHGGKPEGMYEILSGGHVGTRFIGRKNA